MRSALATIVVAALAGGRATAGAPSAPRGIETPVSVSWTDAELTECLVDLARQTGTGFILDPTLGEDVRASKVTYAGAGVTLATALGHALKAAGLRYAIHRGSILISTEKGLAKKIVYGQTRPAVESKPMDLGEALSILSVAEDEEGDDVPLSDLRQIHNKPWRQIPKPTVNPLTGLMDFPGPPVWIASPDANSPKWRYTSRPSFLRPEYLDELSTEARSEIERMGRLADMIGRAVNEPRPKNPLAVRPPTLIDILTPPPVPEPSPPAPKSTPPPAPPPPSE
ncbi:MAG: hypothetical protein ACYS9X_26980 [Planctomycetota bacterium]|jgi:hypothetical protein